MHHNLWLVEHNGGGLVTIVIRYTPLQVEMALVVLAGNTGSNLIGCRFPGLQSASFSACSQLNKEGLVHLFIGKSVHIQKHSLLLTPFSGTVFHPYGVRHFVKSVCLMLKERQWKLKFSNVLWSVSVFYECTEVQPWERYIRIVI